MTKSFGITRVARRAADNLNNAIARTEAELVKVKARARKAEWRLTQLARLAAGRKNHARLVRELANMKERNLKLALRNDELEKENRLLKYQHKRTTVRA